MPCIDSAVSASIPSLPMPELRMKAPGTARRIVLVRLMGAPPRKQQLSTKSYGMGLRDPPRRPDPANCPPAGPTADAHHGGRSFELNATARAAGRGLAGGDIARQGAARRDVARGR